MTLHPNSMKSCDFIFGRLQGVGKSREILYEVKEVMTLHPNSIKSCDFIFGRLQGVIMI